MQILSIVFLTAFIFFSCSKVEEKKEVKHEPLVKTITEYTYQYSFGEPEQNGTKKSHTVFRYDSLKHLIEKIKYDEDGVDEKVIYEYNSGGHLIKELEYASYMNEDDEPYTTTYVLDSLNRTFEMTKDK